MTATTAIIQSHSIAISFWCLAQDAPAERAANLVTTARDYTHAAFGYVVSGAMPNHQDYVEATNDALAAATDAECGAAIQAHAQAIEVLAATL